LTAQLFATMVWLAVFAMTLASALGLADNNALRGRSSEFTFDGQWRAAKKEY